jgi:hypothetical protein
MEKLALQLASVDSFNILLIEQCYSSKKLYSIKLNSSCSRWDIASVWGHGICISGQQGGFMIEDQFGYFAYCNNI